MSYLAKLLPDRNYIKNFSTLISGAVLGQIITLFLAPVLARLYSPNEFGIFASYSATVAILSVVCCARYDLAILLPKKIKESLLVVKICLLISLLISIISAFIIFFLWFIIDINEYKFLVFIPLVIFITSVNITLIYFNDKLLNFKLNSIVRVSQALFTGGAAILFFYILNQNGLILGAISGQLICSALLIYYLPSNHRRSLFYDYNIKKLKKITFEYIDLPKYSLIPSFLNVFSSQSINYYLILVFGTVVTGNYYMSSKVVLLPAGLISAAFTEVFYQKITERSNTKKKIFPFVSNNLLYMLIAALLLFFIFYFFGYNLFILVFGEKWIQSAELISILSFNMLIRTIVSPLTIVFIALNKVKLGGIWQYLYFFTFNLLILLLYYFEIEFILTLKILVFYDLIIYSIALILILLISKQFDNKYAN